jgi:hypothetical protein
VRLARDVAAGMAYLHGLSPSVMHRDLKRYVCRLKEEEEGGGRVDFCIIVSRSP